MTSIYHIPVCPFSQRVEILLKLKKLEDLVKFVVIDITKPRPKWLLEKLNGPSPLPVLETSEGEIIKESLVIMDYFEQGHKKTPVLKINGLERKIEDELCSFEGAYVNSGYSFILNQDKEKRDDFIKEMLDHYRKFNNFLMQYSPEGTFLFNEFGWAEIVYTPMFMRFWFLEYYENFSIPETEEFARFKKWHDACVSHPIANQVTKEEIIKLYYDYSIGVGNGSVAKGREISSFVFEPHWSKRPYPPRDKYNYRATDQELGLS